MDQRRFVHEVNGRSRRVGWGGWFNPWLGQWPNYANNRLTTNPWTAAAMTYDAAGNLTYDGYQSYLYDATGQQTYASGTNLTQSYDGDGLRVKRGCEQFWVVSEMFSVMGRGNITHVVKGASGPRKG